MPISREVQQLKANVTEAADEAVVGIEMVQAFGREDDVQARFAREGRGGARRRAAPGAHRGGVPARAALPADALDRRRRLLRRPRRDRRHAHLRRVLPLLPTAPAARLAARGARLDPLARAARDRLRLAQLRLARRESSRSPSRASRPSLPAGGRLGVRFEDVHFSLRHAAPRCSRASTSTIAPGEVIAVCGPTGAGKTSLLNLLPRFYDPTDGRVLVGGVDVRDLRARGAAHAPSRSSRSGRSSSRSRCATT